MKRLLFLLLAAAASLCAQEFRSTLMGRVTDPSGLGVPNATIVVTKTDTNAKSRTTSGPDGNYTLPFLAPGPYEVTVDAAGFKKYVHSGLDITANQRVAEDVQLQVGSAADSITVSSEAPLVNSMTASLGQVISTREVEDLPMNGNTPLALARNALGVIPKQKHLLNEVKPYDTASAVDISLGGANSGSNEYLLDGVPNMGNASRTGAFSPSMDAVDEVKVELFQADAAYGDTLGGTVTITTKSGTNHYHGTAYEFNQTSALSANQFFLNAAGLQQVVTRSNQYGGTLGGPMSVPKVINGKDRLFFFLAYEGFQDSTPGVFTSAVPTAAERGGDFSALLSAGSGYQLYDPNSAILSAGKITRLPLAGNIIPASRINPIAKAYLQYFPLPNEPGKAAGENNYIVPNPSIDRFTSWIGRADANISSRNKLFFNWHNSSYTGVQADVFHNLASGQYSGNDIFGGLLDDVHTFSPTVVLDTRFGVTRSYPYSSIKSAGFDPESLGFPAYMATSSLRLAMPRIGFSDAYGGLSTAPGTIAPFTSYQWFTSVTKVWNRHTIKAGYDFRRYDANSLNPGNSAGSFTFGTNWITQGTGFSAPAFGGSMASFLLGLPTGGSYDVNTAFAYRSWLYGAFLQDDWRVTPTLTLNVGLRIEHETPLVERYNHIVNGFDPAAVNSIAQAAAAAYAKSPIAQLPASAFSAAGGLTFASADHRSGYGLPSFFPSPRFGLSWAPAVFHHKTVFRGGFGIFNNSIGAFLTGPNTGFSQTTTMVPTNDNYVTAAATFSNPFPGGILNPVGAAAGVNTNLGNSVSFYTGNITNPYSIRWNFDIQRQIGQSMMFEVGYIGNKQVHGTLSNSLSATPVLPFLSRSLTRDQATINALGLLVANPFANLLPGTSLNGPTISVATLLQAYPEFSGVVQSNSNPSWGTFNELIVIFQRRFSKGLQATVNYQHSRQLGAYQANPGDYKLSYGVTSGDYPDHFVITGSYELPFGHGRQFLGNVNRVFDLAIGGWILNTVYTWECGSALSWGNVLYYGGPLNLQPRNLTQAFDVTRFERLSANQPSQNYRTFPQMFNNLRSDAANNVDLSMLKNFRVTERVSAQFRFETFNSFNRTEFAAPNLSPTSTAFGTITAQANTPRQLQLGLKLRF